MDGVGEEWECPKNRLVFVRFQCESAVRRIPVGAGCVVDLWCICSAFGLQDGNFIVCTNCGGVERKVCVIGPHHPWGSITNGRSIVLAWRSL